MAAVAGAVAQTLVAVAVTVAKTLRPRLVRMLGVRKIALDCCQPLCWAQIADIAVRLLAAARAAERLSRGGNAATDGEVGLAPGVHSDTLVENCDRGGVSQASFVDSESLDAAW